MQYCSTREVAELLGVKPGRLTRAVWEGRISRPLMGPGHAFCWGEVDIRQASWVLLDRDLDDVAEDWRASYE
jgi:hypothetical protein